MDLDFTYMTTEELNELIAQIKEVKEARAESRKTADKRSVSIFVGSTEAEKQNRKTVFLTDEDGGILSAYSLTPDQIRLLEELERQEYLSDEIHIATQNNIEIVEI